MQAACSADTRTCRQRAVQTLSTCSTCLFASLKQVDNDETDMATQRNLIICFLFYGKQ